MESVLHRRTQTVNYGFPISIRRGNWCTGLKTKAFSNCPSLQGADTNTVIQYLGIAADEEKRLERLDGVTKISPLAAVGWTEADARKWCEENDLLSPIYTTAARGGCWFCHNQGLEQLRLLRKNYPDLWALLMKWDLDSPVTFKADGHTVHDYDLRFQAELEGRVPTDRKFRWKMLINKEETIMATATKKTEEAEQNEVNYASMNVFQKLQLARVDFLNSGVKKSGKNIKLEFMYFELADIVPMAEKLFAKYNLLGVTHFTADTGYMDVYDGDHPDNLPISFSAPFTIIAPIVSNSTGKAVTNEMQALGSSITYMRRYLWQLVMDIIEIDTIDSGVGSDDDAPETPKPKKAPVTPEKRQEIKKELTAPAAAADELQINALKAGLKQLLETDPEQEGFIQEIAVRTEGFTKITKEACEKLILNIGDMISAYSAQEG